ncbi:MAG: DUF1403 family protein [Mesorhizobium sp.]|nr:MAG: DUF1403 family protein [Mesorhizobium sp.]
MAKSAPELYPPNQLDAVRELSGRPTFRLFGL